MSDDFQTVNAKRGDRARELDALRARYRSHRETLMGLVADAPTELIAADYRRVIADIDVALARLNELGGAVAPPPVAPPPHPARRGTEPGMRPLVAPPASSVHDDETINYTSAGSDSRSRLLLIGAAALVALGAIGGLIWWASDRRGDDAPAVVEQPAGTDSATTVVEEAPETATRGAAAGRALAITPDSVDYGIVRKGTRITRQYEIVNNSDEPISPQVARSTCRCLYYEYAPVIPPKAKETLTVTIDGAKAKPGPLLESIRVSAKSDPSIVATFDVTATVR